jgi:hypothetical protein
MARKRMIDPSFWEDLDIAKLSVPARLCFLGMLSHADDDGRIEADPRYIKRAVFGFDDELSSGDVAHLLSEIVTSCSNVIFYEVNGRALAAFRNWERYQYIQKPQASKLPPPPLPYEYDTDTVPVAPNRIEKNRIEKNRTRNHAPAPASPVSDSSSKTPTVVGALIDLGLLRDQAVGLAKKNPDLDVAGVAAWQEWMTSCTADNPVAIVVKHLKEGRSLPPVRYNGTNGKHGPALPPAPTETWEEMQAFARQVYDAELAAGDITLDDVPEWYRETTH